MAAKEGCDYECYPILSEVCASLNGKEETFLNACELEKSQCEDPGWTLVKKGNCKLNMQLQAYE